MSAHGRVVAATDPGTGTPVELPAVLERLGWLCTIAGELARPIMAAHGNPADVRLFVSGKIPGGGRRARKAYKALEQLGWAAPPAAPGGLFVPSRVRRMASEHAGRTLRSSAVQLELTEAMLRCWPQHVDLDQLPTKPVMVLVRNTRRHLRNHLKTQGVPLDQPLTAAANSIAAHPGPPSLPGGLVQSPARAVRVHPPAGGGFPGELAYLPSRC